MSDNVTIFIDGDFPSGEECKYHCYPSCHPAQVGPDPVFGCTHPSWTVDGFCPIVECQGVLQKCELSFKLVKRQKSGLERRIRNAKKKIEKYEKQIDELEGFLGVLNEPK